MNRSRRELFARPRLMKAFDFAHLDLNVSRARTALSLLLMCALGFVHGASAATLQDFIEAKANQDNGERPCLCIPYEDIRRDCIENGKVVTNLCKIVQWTCTADHDTDPVLVNIKKKNEELDKLKDVNADLNTELDKLKEAEKDEDKIADLQQKIKENENETTQANDELKNLTNDLDDRREKLKKRVEWGQACLSSREEARKNFEQAISKGENEADNDIQPIAQDLVVRWKASIEEHQPEIDATVKRIKECQDMLDQTAPR